MFKADHDFGERQVRLLKPAWQNDGRVLLYRLEGDMLAVTDLLPLTNEFMFVDAAAGKVAGEMVRGAKIQRAFAPSFRQTVMQSLEALKLVEPFPRWELWGVTILSPTELRQGLSSAVARAAQQLAGALDAHLRERLNGSL